MKPTHPLAQWRKRHNMSQAKLAHACGLSASMIAKIEQYDRIPFRDTLERLLSVTALPTDALVRPEKFLEAHPDYLA
jgi:transcriptional regulator with XRE-family HTH domain